MPVSGLLALLDDIASLADHAGAMASVAARKGSAAGRDVALLTKAAATKTSGVVTDDMAVTAEQAIGIRAEREIPVVLAVARGSFKNKALYLAPGALVLNAVAPWAITPVLMLGGTYLAFEGVEKVIHWIRPHGDEHGGDGGPDPLLDAEAFERSRVDGAIRTDLILSAEIIAISLGEVAAAPFVTQVLALYAISIVMTVGVYGVVGGLVKLDDLGLHMSEKRGAGAGIGRMLLAGAPKLLHLISIVGTFAMLMVGGHILIEGIHPVEELVHHAKELVPAMLSGVLGLALDIVVGAIAGGIVVGVAATGVFGLIAKGIARLRKPS